MYAKVFRLQADLLKALAHPKRLEIVNLLRDQEMGVTDIYSMLDLPQANVSQHLMILRDARVVSTRKEGKQVVYGVLDPRVIRACDLLREVLIDLAGDEETANGFKYSMKELVPIVHDPVCGMRVSPKTAGFNYEWGGEVYYFCASGCLKKFQERPEEYEQK